MLGSLSLVQPEWKEIDGMRLVVNRFSNGRLPFVQVWPGERGFAGEFRRNRVNYSLNPYVLRFANADVTIELLSRVPALEPII